MKDTSLFKKIGVGILGVGIIFGATFFQVYGIDYALDSSSRVYDRAGVIDQNLENSMNAALIELEKSSIGQVIVITLPDLEGRTIEEVALNFGRENGVGDGERNTGLAVLVAIEERQRRIEVGYGLEGYITDLQAYRLGQDILVPAFRAGEYGLGLQLLTNEIASVLMGEKELAIPNSITSGENITLFEIFIFGVFVAFFFGGIVATGKPNTTTKNVTSGLGSGITGIIAVLLTTGWGLLIAVPLYFVRKASINSERKAGPPVGGGGRGRGGGSFSGGGFSGFGGGSFGGGGAGGSR